MNDTLDLTALVPYQRREINQTGVRRLKELKYFWKQASSDIYNTVKRQICSTPSTLLPLFRFHHTKTPKFPATNLEQTRGQHILLD